MKKKYYNPEVIVALFTPLQIVCSSNPMGDPDPTNDTPSAPARQLYN